MRLDAPPCYSFLYRLFVFALTACQCCRPKLNAFVRSLFSLTLIEFCEFHLPHCCTDCLCFFFHSTCCYSSSRSCSCCFLLLFYLLAPWPLGRLAAGATFIWLNLLWTITKTVENCCPRRGVEAYAKLGRQLLAYPAILQELRSPSPYGQWHELSS